jgi:hypothetical protein
MDRRSSACVTRTRCHRSRACRPSCDRQASRPVAHLWRTCVADQLSDHSVVVGNEPAVEVGAADAQAAVGESSSAGRGAAWNLRDGTLLVSIPLSWTVAFRRRTPHRSCRRRRQRRWAGAHRRTGLPAPPMVTTWPDAEVGPDDCAGAVCIAHASGELRRQKTSDEVASVRRGRVWPRAACGVAEDALQHPSECCPVSDVNDPGQRRGRDLHGLRILTIAVPSSSGGVGGPSTAGQRHDWAAPLEAMSDVVVGDLAPVDHERSRGAGSGHRVGYVR